MMKRLLLLTIWVWVILTACQPSSTSSPFDTSDLPTIKGKASYLASPFVTAGDRLYMVGHQDGKFPDLGWHVQDEMGGIWAHPIKLMDGFTLGVQQGNDMYCLTEADTFINYPFANRHRYTKGIADLEIDRLQFVPDGQAGIVILYQITHQQATPLDLTLHLAGMVDLRPVWLGERTGLGDEEDQLTWDEAASVLVGKDEANRGEVRFGSTVAASGHEIGTPICDFEHVGKGKTGTITYQIQVGANETFAFPLFIANDQKTYNQLTTNYAQLFEEKKQRFAQLKQKAELNIPDPELAETFEWLKYNTDWLIQEVPGVGRGLTAGIPDYPWWFGADTEYALKGAIAIGRKELVYETIDLIHRISDTLNGNGRILHEVSTNSAVFNPGNINETPQFASLIWHVYEWTGDKAFLEKYYPTVQKGLNWLMTEKDKDGNLLPDGFGMMEIHGLNSEMIDVAAYTQRAFADAAKMAQQLGLADDEDRYKDMASQLEEKINTDFWVGEFNSYADFVGTTAQARHLIEDAIVRADTLDKPWAVEELEATQAQIASYPATQKQGFVLHHNWVVNTPMEMGISPAAYAIPALNTGSQFVNPFGMFVTGIDRDETAGQDMGSFAADKKIFSYTGAVMTLPTGVQAVAENNYGRPDEALDYLQRMTRSFSYAFPGSMYEVSPDFGMIVQAWNIYSFGVPIIQQFFGVKPQAYKQTIVIQPQMPSTWNEAELKQVEVGDNVISIRYERVGEGMKMNISQTKENWKVIVKVPEKTYKSCEVNGNTISLDASLTSDQRWRKFEQVALTGTSWEVRLE
ncbi:MAG: glycogen debranching protein [Bacteroidota bacterium]